MLTLALGLACRASAVDSPVSNPETAADTAYAEAQRLFDSGDCRSALPAFAAAYKLRAHPRGLLHLGHCYRKLGDLDSAAGAYAMVTERHEGSPLAGRARELLVLVEGERAAAAKEGKPARTFSVPRLAELALPPRAGAPGLAEKKKPAPAAAPAPSPASAPEAAQNLVVLGFRNRLDSKIHIDMDYLTDKVRGAVLDAAPTFKVMTRENLVALLEASGKDMAKCEGECEVETGRRVGADLVVSGDLTKFGTNLKVTLRLHATRQSLLVSTAEATGTTLEELDLAVVPAVKKLLVTRTKAPSDSVNPGQQPKPPAKTTWPVWAAGGVAVAALASGVVFSVGAKSASNSLAQGGNSKAAADGFATTLRSDTQAANISFAIAGVAAVGAVVAYLVFAR